MNSPIERETGFKGIAAIAVVLILFFSTFIFAFIIQTERAEFALVLLVFPFMFILLWKIFSNPIFGIFTIVAYGFFANGFNRYIPGVTFGLGIDGLLIITYVALFFYSFNKNVEWSSVFKDITLLYTIWFAYALVELMNPEKNSTEAWFYAMRGISLYVFLMVPLVLLLFHKYQSVNIFLYIWGVLSILASIKGFIQVNIGLDPFEKAWLFTGGPSTHIIFGKLRAFSFYSDAGQFGAAQAHAGVIGAIIFINTRSVKEKVFFAIMSITGFYGMFISGTRGAIAVPFAGLFLYLILTRNIKMVALGIVMGMMVFVFFKFTSIGSGVYAIQRMRTAFNPNDPSLQVRLANQRILRLYLATRPMGGGIGSAGNWGKRFSPNGFLANVATDSWYVQIWAEQGIIGLVLHIFIMVYVVGKGSFLSVFRVTHPVLQAKLFAMAAGIFGVMAASYGNGVLGQLPTGPLIYVSVAVMFLAKELNDDANLTDPIIEEE